MTTLATTWLTGCGGCHATLLDGEVGLLQASGDVKLRACPLLSDVKQMPEVDIALVEGAVSTTDDEAVLQAVRRKARRLIAVGTCACFGGVPGLRNLHSREEVLRRAYVNNESTEQDRPPDAPQLPKLKPFVRPLHQVVEVDGSIPGCPPTSRMLQAGLRALYDGRVPPLSKRNLCDQCQRRHSFKEATEWEFFTDDVYAVCELVDVDPTLCFVEQGVPCLGIATREGCGARCLESNMPCRGCMGPTPHALEQGAKWINAVASVLPAGPLTLHNDIIGLGYSYALAVSLAPHVVTPEDEGDE